jgi:hypothetical protein
VNWTESYNTVLPYLFSIETPEGRGSGFFLAHNEERTVIAVATAAHVVQEAHNWKLPLKLRHHETDKEVFVEPSDRGILIDPERDSAVIILSASELQLPTESLSMFSHEEYLTPGTEVGWMGYPWIAAPHLCFFSGKVSAFIHDNDSYLIDGVAINGVSGGPVFHISRGTTTLVGAVSAYLPNRVRGKSLPGLASVQDVTAFHLAVNNMRSLDEARRKESENVRPDVAGVEPPKK